MKAFENFYKNRSADDEEKGVKPVFEFARELAHNEENWFTQKSQDTKRKRKTTKKMAESLGQDYEDGAEKENLSAKSAKCKKTDENEEIINKSKSTKKSNTKKIKEDAQKGAVQTVLQSILPTLQGGFAAQWGSPSLSKSYSNQSISLTSVPVSQQNTSNQTTPTTQLQLHNSNFTQTATKGNQIQPPVSTSTAPIQLSVSTTTVLPASHPCLVPKTVKTTKTPAPTLTPIPTEPQIPTQTQHSTSKPQETPVTNDIARNSVISQLSTKISTQEILTVSGTVMTPRQCTQQRPGPSPQARHQLHLTPNHNLTIQSDPSSSLPNTPPEEMNSGANWTNIIMSPYYPDPNEILDEIRLINKPTYQDLEKTIQELTDINKNLKDEIKSLQQQLRLKQTNNETSSGQIKGKLNNYLYVGEIISTNISFFHIQSIN